jgi:hypothetical protein
MDKGSNISLLVALLPQYRLLNMLCQQTVDSGVLSFDAQCSITDFHNQFNNKQAFEKAVLNMLLSADKDKTAPVITNLRTEIRKNIDIYTSNKDFFDGIDTIKVCKSRYNPLNIEIEGQLKDTNIIGKELTQVRNSLESASWKGDKIAMQRLTQEAERAESRYKKEHEKLESLYQQQKESDDKASRYIYNVFGNISELSISFLSLLDNYYPVERKKEQAEVKPSIKPGLYFDMKLVSAIHHECNNIQFENLTEVDLYAILNLQPTNAKLTVKSGERTRMCYLIYRLYEFLKTDNKAGWRTAILDAADIDDKYYKSKYKEPESEIPSRKSESFAQRINKIFEYLS